MSAALTHALLALAVLALGAAAMRGASTLAPSGLERVLAAAAIGVCAACLEALALGLAGLGSEPLALSAAALATYVLARRLLDTPRVPPAVELAAWWRGRSTGERAVLGALGGLFAAWAAWMLEYPYLGEDGVRYRLPTVIAWIQEGSPGALVASPQEYATDAYPLGNELALAWPMAIARSFVPATLWTPALVGLAAASGWYGLRTLSVPRAVAALAVVALCALPLNVEHLNEPNADVAALAWTVCAAALCAGCARRPGLLAPALLAGALGVGAKTTALVPVLCALALGVWVARRSLGAARTPLLTAVAAATAVGGLWYLRNLVLHGSPLWPFVAAPWGDPSPPLIKALDHSLLERPRATLTGNVDVYLRTLAGGTILAAGALAAPLLDRSRETALAAAAAGLALLAYAAAPVTGLGDAGLTGFPALSLRYLLPALGVCVLPIALAARRSRRAAWLAAAVLIGATAWSVGRDLGLGFPLVPSAATLGLAAAIGALAAVAVPTGVVERLRHPIRNHGRVSPTRRRQALAVACAVAGGVAMSLPAEGYLERHARIAQAPFVEVPRFFSGPSAPPQTAPVGFHPAIDARVAGDRLRRPLRLLQADLPCASYRRGWMVMMPSSAVLNAVSDLELPAGPLERCDYGDRPPVGLAQRLAIYPPGRRTRP